ncbi:MAG TPA: ABC transporter permease [Pyrinomonadaceae bacterium]|nr:ABC transporter permease [Pyrinomonadaceae bacterium]
MNSFFRIFVPRRIRFEAQVAVRHLVSGGGQTLLTVSAVAAGVIIVIFITSLIFGLQQQLTELLTDAIPHVTVTVEEPKPRPLSRVPGNESDLSSTQIEQRAPQLKFIDNYPAVVDTIRRLPNVREVAPVVSGQAFISKGANPIGVAVVGADPELQDRITPVSKDLISGKYLGLGSDEIVIDGELAKDLDVSTGERVRVTSGTGVSDSFTIAGIYSRGQGRGSAYVTLRTGQSLFGFGSTVNAIYVKLIDIYNADSVADQIMALVPYEAKSWTREFPQFLSSLQVQTASAYLISGFSLVASGFAIAAVLIVSVLQKSKQIGILKSMGARRRQILTVFIFEGFGVAVVGSALGAIVGGVIVLLLSLFKQPITRVGQTPEQLFPVRLIPFYIAVAIIAAIVSTVLAAVLPARRAAKMNPVDVMR